MHAPRIAALFLVLFLLLSGIPFSTQADTDSSTMSADKICINPNADYSCDYGQPSKKPGKVCWYDRPCKADEIGGSVPASGGCIAQNVCRATKCAGGPCKTADVPVQPVTLQGTPLQPLIPPLTPGTDGFQPNNSIISNMFNYPQSPPGEFPGENQDLNSGFKFNDYLQTVFFPGGEPPQFETPPLFQGPASNLVPSQEDAGGPPVVIGSDATKLGPFTGFDVPPQPTESTEPWYKRAWEGVKDYFSPDPQLVQNIADAQKGTLVPTEEPPPAGDVTPQTPSNAGSPNLQNPEDARDAANRLRESIQNASLANEQYNQFLFDRAVEVTPDGQYKFLPQDLKTAQELGNNALAAQLEYQAAKSDWDALPARNRYYESLQQANGASQQTITAAREQIGNIDRAAASLTPADGEAYYNAYRDFTETKPALEKQIADAQALISTRNAALNALSTMPSAEANVAAEKLMSGTDAEKTVIARNVADYAAAQNTLNRFDGGQSVDGKINQFLGKWYQDFVRPYYQTPVDTALSSIRQVGGLEPMTSAVQNPLNSLAGNDGPIYNALYYVSDTLHSLSGLQTLGTFGPVISSSAFLLSIPVDLAIGLVGGTPAQQLALMNASPLERFLDYGNNVAFTALNATIVASPFMSAARTFASAAEDIAASGFARGTLSNFEGVALRGEGALPRISFGEVPPTLVAANDLVAIRVTEGNVISFAEARAARGLSADGIGSAPSGGGISSGVSGASELGGAGAVGRSVGSEPLGAGPRMLQAGNEVPVQGGVPPTAGSSALKPEIELAPPSPIQAPQPFRWNAWSDFNQSRIAANDNFLSRVITNDNIPTGVLQPSLSSPFVNPLAAFAGQPSTPLSFSPPPEFSALPASPEIVPASSFSIYPEPTVALSPSLEPPLSPASAGEIAPVSPYEPSSVNPIPLVSKPITIIDYIRQNFGDVAAQAARDAQLQYGDPWAFLSMLSGAGGAPVPTPATAPAQAPSQAPSVTAPVPYLVQPPSLLQSIGQTIARALSPSPIVPLAPPLSLVPKKWETELAGIPVVRTTIAPISPLEKSAVDQLNLALVDYKNSIPKSTNAPEIGQTDIDRIRAIENALRGIGEAGLSPQPDGSFARTDGTVVADLLPAKNGSGPYGITLPEQLPLTSRLASEIGQTQLSVPLAETAHSVSVADIWAAIMSGSMANLRQVLAGKPLPGNEPALPPVSEEQLGEIALESQVPVGAPTIFPPAPSRLANLPQVVTLALSLASGLGTSAAAEPFKLAALPPVASPSLPAIVPPRSVKPSDSFAARTTFYGPGAGGSVQGGWETAFPNLEGRSVPHTLDEVRLGKSRYVSVATAPENRGKFFYLGDVTYRSPIDNKIYTVKDVYGYSHDMGDAFKAGTCAKYNTCNVRLSKVDIAVGDFRGWSGSRAYAFLTGPGQSYGGNVVHPWQQVASLPSATKPATVAQTPVASPATPATPATAPVPQTPTAEASKPTVIARSGEPTPETPAPPSPASTQSPRELPQEQVQNVQKEIADAEDSIKDTRSQIRSNQEVIKKVQGLQTVVAREIDPRLATLQEIKNKLEKDPGISDVERGLTTARELGREAQKLVASNSPLLPEARTKLRNAITQVTKATKSGEDLLAYYSKLTVAQALSQKESLEWQTRQIANRLLTSAQGLVGESNTSLKSQLASVQGVQRELAGKVVELQTTKNQLAARLEATQQPAAGTSPEPPITVAAVEPPSPETPEAPAPASLTLFTPPAVASTPYSSAEKKDLIARFNLTQIDPKIAESVLPPRPAPYPQTLPAQTDPLLNKPIGELTDSEKISIIRKSERAIQDYWEKVFRANGGEYRRADVVIIDSVSKTNLEEGENPYHLFMGATGRVYIDLHDIRVTHQVSSLSDATGIVIAQSVAHEMGHYFARITALDLNANRAEIYSDGKVKPPLSAVTGYSNLALQELQADYFAGVSLKGSGLLGTGDPELLYYDVASTGDDVGRVFVEESPTAKPYTHGTGADRAQVFYEGLTAGNLDKGLAMLGTSPDWKLANASIPWGKITLGTPPSTLATIESSGGIAVTETTLAQPGLTSIDAAANSVPVENTFGSSDYTITPTQSSQTPTLQTPVPQQTVVQESFGVPWAPTIVQYTFSHSMFAPPAPSPTLQARTSLAVRPREPEVQEGAGAAQPENALPLKPLPPAPSLVEATAAREKYLQDPVTPTDAFKNFPRSKLTGADVELQEASIAKYLSNEKRLLKDYRMYFGDKDVNPDFARLLFRDIGYNGTNSGAVQKVVADMTENLWRENLANPGEYVAIYTGSSGAGKSSVAEAFLKGITSDTAAILDGTLSNPKIAQQRIAEALKAGKKVQIVNVYRDPIDAWNNGVIARMNGDSIDTTDTGRVVPISVFAISYKRSLEIVQSLLRNPQEGVEVTLIDNSKGSGNQTEMSPEEFLAIRYSSKIESTIRDDTKNLLNQGVITPEQYAAITGAEAPAKLAVASTEPVVPLDVDISTLPSNISPESGPLTTSNEILNQPLPTLEERADLYLRAVYGPDYVPTVAEKADAQQRVAGAMAKDAMQNAWSPYSVFRVIENSDLPAETRNTIRASEPNLSVVENPTPSSAEETIPRTTAFGKLLTQLEDWLGGAEKTPPALKVVENPNPTPATQESTRSAEAQRSQLRVVGSENAPEPKTIVLPEESQIESPVASAPTTPATPAPETPTPSPTTPPVAEPSSEPVVPGVASAEPSPAATVPVSTGRSVSGIDSSGSTKYTFNSIPQDSSPVPKTFDVSKAQNVQWAGNVVTLQQQGMSWTGNSSFPESVVSAVNGENKYTECLQSCLTLIGIAEEKGGNNVISFLTHNMLSGVVSSKDIIASAVRELTLRSTPGSVRFYVAGGSVPNGEQAADWRNYYNSAIDGYKNIVNDELTQLQTSGTDVAPLSFQVLNDPTNIGFTNVYLETQNQHITIAAPEVTPTVQMDQNLATLTSNVFSWLGSLLPQRSTAVPAPAPSPITPPVAEPSSEPVVPGVASAEPSPAATVPPALQTGAQVVRVLRGLALPGDLSPVPPFGIVRNVALNTISYLIAGPAMPLLNAGYRFTVNSAYRADVLELVSRTRGLSLAKATNAVLETVPVSVGEPMIETPTLADESISNLRSPASRFELSPQGVDITGGDAGGKPPAGGPPNEPPGTEGPNNPGGGGFWSSMKNHPFRWILGGVLGFGTVGWIAYLESNRPDANVPAGQQPPPNKPSGPATTPPPAPAQPAPPKKETVTQPPPPPPRQPGAVTVGRPASGGLGGTVLSQNDYCITSIEPMIVIPLSAGTRFPSNCYNSPAGGSSSIGSMLGQLLAKLLGIGQPQQTPSQRAPRSPDQRPATSSPPVVTLIANPSTVASGTKAILAWSSIGTSQCSILTSLGVEIGQGTNGATSTPQLATTTAFTAQCATPLGTNIMNMATVTVATTTP